MGNEKNPQESIKWWVDQGKSTRERPKNGPPPPTGARFYVTAKGYEQDQAREAIIDLNVKLLTKANPPENGFGYLNLIDERSSPAYLEKVKRALPLPKGARAVIVDSGRMVRVILTGDPIGERVLEFNFNREEPTFDVWVRGDWKKEILFRSLGELYRKAPRLIERYMGAEALAAPEFLT